jgi:NDT80 / PhoG like DNA-binding  family
MEGYDAVPTMNQYLSTPLPNVPDALSMSMVPMDNLDPATFDPDVYAGYVHMLRSSGVNLDTVSAASNRDYSSDDASQFIQPPGMKRFSTHYDDGYSDVLSNFEATFPAEPNQVESSIDRDHKLLSFSTPSLQYTLLDYTLRPVSASITAQLHGMFFLAESSIPTSAESAPPLTELTCYRRNLFQVTGNLTIPRGLRFVITEQGDQIPVIGYELSISATETIEGNAVKIICVPWKTPATSAPTVEDKSEKEPISMPIDLTQGEDLESEFVTIPIAWKRLQFRIATANNGRRKELQQHFLVHLRVMATLSTGARVSICEVQSGAIIVRGRSPRNFQSKKDMPISGTGAFGRRSHHVSRHSTGEASLSQHSQPKAEHQDQHLGFDLSHIPYSFDSQALAVSGDLFDWKVPTGQVGALTALPPNISITGVGGVNAYAHSSPDLTRDLPRSRSLPKAPINLFLVDEDLNLDVNANELVMPHSAPIGKSWTGAPSPSLKRPRTDQSTPVRPPSFSITPLSMTDESADMLYEYFPLGLDDWMPPVDAVYRPHVVHHTNLPTDPKAIKNRGKRYFSEDQP